MDTLASYYVICGLIEAEHEFENDEARWECVRKLLPLTAAYPEARET